MMQTIQFIVILLAIVLGVWLLISHFGVIWKIFYNSIIGMLALLLVNLIGAPLSIHIGINAFTCLICGILGIPGFIMLFIMRFLV